MLKNTIKRLLMLKHTSKRLPIKQKYKKNVWHLKIIFGFVWMHQHGQVFYTLKIYHMAILLSLPLAC